MSATLSTHQHYQQQQQQQQQQMLLQQGATSDLVKGDNTFFVATGVTDGNLVRGVQRKGPIIRTESIVLRARSGTIRRVLADHLVKKWLDDVAE